jgi:integrase
VAGIKSERWPTSNRNPWPDCLGIRTVGVEEVVPGRRRSLVNFHSFRRYFITKAEQADQMEHIIAVVVGHKRTGMTLGRYSGGPLLEQARRCVEAVRLP